jgi:hypothetical protein
LYIAGVVGLLSLGAHLGAPGSLGLDGAAFVIAGAWCSLNFWRCRHAHCLVTGAGWLALGVFALVEAGLGHSLIGGYEQPGFLAVLGAGIAFELAWAMWRGTNAVTRPTGN